MMGSNLLQGALRWIFWGVLYLAVALVALVLTFGTMAPYLPAPVRYAMLGTFLYGIALDAKNKADGGPDRTAKPRPPSGGDLAPRPVRSNDDA